MNQNDPPSHDRSLPTDTHDEARRAGEMPRGIDPGPEADQHFLDERHQALKTWSHIASSIKRLERLRENSNRTSEAQLGRASHGARWLPSTSQDDRYEIRLSRTMLTLRDQVVQGQLLDEAYLRPIDSVGQPKPGRAIETPLAAGSYRSHRLESPLRRFEMMAQPIEADDSAG